MMPLSWMCPNFASRAFVTKISTKLDLGLNIFYFARNHKHTTFFTADSAKIGLSKRN